MIIDLKNCFLIRHPAKVINSYIKKNDLKDIDSVTEACEAGGGCHSCHILIQLFIDQYLEKTTPMEDLVQDHAQKIKKEGILSRFFKNF